jgi:hypothetical protein
MGWVAVLAVTSGLWFGSIRTLQAAARYTQNTVQGSVVSVTNNSITILVKQKNPNDPDQLTFACSAQTTKVGLKTPDGVQVVSGQTIGVGDKVAIRASMRGSQNLVADQILIVSQGNNNQPKKPAKSQ